MGTRTRGLVVLLSCALMLAAGLVFAAVAANYTLPKWPQTFTVNPGQSVSFGFPVTQPGEIVVDLEWTGSPLSVALRQTDTSGANSPRPIAPISQNQLQPSKSRATFSISAADLKQGPMWQVALTAPASGTPPTTKASLAKASAGRITITTPPVDNTKVSAQIDALLKGRPKAQPKGPVDKASSSTTSRIDSFNLERDKKLAAQREQLLAQARASAPPTTQVARSLKRTTLSAATWAAAAQTTRRLGTVGPSISTAKSKIQTYTKPTILNMSVGKGAPGDEVVINAAGINDDPAGKQVLFTIQPMVTVPGKLISTASSGGQVVLTVAVPPPAQNGALAYTGQVVLQDETGVSSNAMPFDFVPILVPTLSQIRSTPMAGVTQEGPRLPGYTLEITGANLVPTSRMYFIYPWAPQTPVLSASDKVDSALLMHSTIPAYSQQLKRFTAKVFVRYRYTSKYLTGDIDSDEMEVYLDAQKPSISQTSVTTVQPLTSVMFNGSGFLDVPGDIKMFLPSGGQIMEVLLWTDSEIVARVPNIGGIAASTPVKIQLSTKASQMAQAPSTTFEPARDLVFMNLRDDAANWILAIAMTTEADDLHYSQDGTKLIVRHNNRFWNQIRGDDYITYIGGELKNNFRLIAINTTPFTLDPYWGTSKIETPFQNDKWKIHVEYCFSGGVADGWLRDQYEIQVQVEGPRGLSYK